MVECNDLLFKSAAKGMAGKPALLLQPVFVGLDVPWNKCTNRSVFPVLFGKRNADLKPSNIILKLLPGNIYMTFVENIG